MPYPLNNIMQEMQYAYLHAVVSRAGAKVKRTDGNVDFGSDGDISYVKNLPDGKFGDTSITFNFQMKATRRWKLENDHVVYDIGVDSYNKLVTWEGFGFIILILFKMPKEVSNWLVVSEDLFCMKDCCYWFRVPDKRSENTSSVRIKIPRDQLFDVRAVNKLLDEAREAAKKSREVNT
ncbi:MAG: DUF4365 domain-containing protein [Chloroflexi bacterium]|nr:DUF4365 domain-containing protein [Chloroflexota bacterium]